MSSPEEDPNLCEPQWTAIAPVLDDAMARLSDADRTAILLRYFQQRPMREIGDCLGVSEAAAKMRVGRALQKLRDGLAIVGVSSSPSLLATIIEARATGACSSQVAASVTNAVASMTGGSLPRLGMARSLSPTANKLLLSVSGVVVLSALIGGAIQALRVSSGHVVGTSVPGEFVADLNQPPVARAAKPDLRTLAFNSRRPETEEALNRLRLALTQPWPSRKAPFARVVEALETFGDQRSAALPLLMEYLHPSAPLGSRVLAAEGLKVLGKDGSAALPELQRMLKAGELVLLTGAVSGIFPALSVDASPVAGLLDAVADPRLPGRGEAGRAIVRILQTYPEDAESYRGRLQLMMQVPDDETRREAALILVARPLGPDAGALAILRTALRLDRLQDPTAYDPVYFPEQATQVSRDHEREMDNAWRHRIVQGLREGGEMGGEIVADLEALASLVPAGSLLHEEVLLAMAIVEPDRLESLPQVRAAAQAAERARQITERVQQGHADLPELIEGLRYRASASTCAEALPRFGPEEQRLAVEALDRAVSQFETEEAVDLLKTVAPEALVARLARHDLSALGAVVNALKDLGPGAVEALPYLEAVSAELNPQDYGLISAVSEAIQAIDPDQGKTLFTFADLEGATKSLLQIIQAEGKTEGPGYHAYIERLQDQNAVSRARLLNFVNALRPEPELYEAFVGPLLQGHPQLAPHLAGGQ